MFYAVAVVGGLGEGAILGLFQVNVLRGCLPEIDRRRWIVATALAAAFAWGCGMLAPTLDDLVGLPAAAQIAVWIPAGVLILLSIGCAQARVLRGVVEKPERWIVANALGWVAGLPWTFALPALVPPGAPVAVWVSVFVLAGILMGMTTGAIIGIFLVRFVSGRR